MNRMYSFLRLQSKSKRTQKCVVVVIAVLLTIYYLILKLSTSKSPVGGLAETQVVLQAIGSSPQDGIQVELANNSLRKQAGNSTTQAIGGHPQDGIQLDYVLKNTPYRSLNNSHCILQKDGQWDCPDIRTQGQNKMRQVQLVATRMLLIFDALCKKYGLRYWIKRGTLLGTVRHGGFIPWDSDLDIEMPIEDYLDFLRRAVKELPAGVLMQHHKDENKALQRLFRQSTDTHSNSTEAPTLEQVYFSGMNPWNPRLRDENSCYKYCLQVNCSWADGILIDMYPVMLKNGHFIDYHFDRSTKKLWQPFPLRYMKFEGFEVPVQNDWELFLTTIYGKMHMDLPPMETRRLPPESFSIPDALHACSELELDRPSGNVRVKQKSVLQKT